MISQILIEKSGIQPWSTEDGAEISFIPFEEDKIAAMATHSYAIPYIDGEQCIVTRRGDGKWVLPGGTLNPGEKWREGLEREIREEVGAKIICSIPLGMYRIIRKRESSYRVVNVSEVQIVQPVNDADGQAGIVELATISPQEASELFEYKAPYYGCLYILSTHVKAILFQD